MGTTDAGLPYPEGTDSVFEGDDAIHSLADAVNTYVRGGRATVVRDKNGDGTVHITFDPPFGAAPAMVAIAGTNYPNQNSVSVSKVDATGGDIVVASSNDGNLSVHWIAVGSLTASDPVFPLRDEDE